MYQALYGQGKKYQNQQRREQQEQKIKHRIILKKVKRNPWKKTNSSTITGGKKIIDAS